jgi:UDP-N-acetylmuramoyl-tripeptide--D-alanyl-D-alanine ligase
MMNKGLYGVDGIAGLTRGEVFRAKGFAGAEVSRVVCDSRQAAPGALFVPLAGERTDGRLYIADAFSRGCRAAFVDRSFWEAHAEDLRGGAEKFRAAFVIVESSLAALQTLAARHLAERKALRIGISGSNGKTTTKEIAGAILSREAPSFMNRGNLNSEIGLPLSVFEMQGEPDFAVFEMGMNRAGEMDVLVDIVRPQAALITNIALAHIGVLGSLENIAAEKKKLFLALEPGRKAYVYEGEVFRSFLADGVAAEVLPFGENSTPGFALAREAGLDGWDIILDGERLRFPLPGVHNLRNALGAVSLCKGLGVSGGALREGLRAVKPLFGRSQIFRGEVTVLLDCYNANPQSMESAIAFVSSLAWKGRKAAVLGSMKELGALCAEAHRKTAELLAGSAFDAVFLFGEEMEDAFRVLEGAGSSGLLEWRTEFDELKKTVLRFVKAGDLLLVKGSRSMELERLTDILCAASVQAGGVHV